MSKVITGKIPYESFEEKGFDAIIEWYKEIGATDVRDVHVNSKSSKKICAALNKFHNNATAVNMAFLHYGPSGAHDDISDDIYRVNKEGNKQ